jgi:hypothetical protein
MSEKEVTVKIPKEMAKFITDAEWFKKLYRSLEDFVVESTRKRMEQYMWAYPTETIRFNNETYEKLSDLAAKEGLHPSEYVTRTILEKTA